VPNTKLTNRLVNLTAFGFIRGEMVCCFAIFVLCGMNESTHFRVPSWLLYEVYGIIGGYFIFSILKQGILDTISRRWIPVLNAMRLLFTFAFIVSLIILSGNLGRFWIAIFSVSFLTLNLILKGRNEK
jgi:hypothetical protein